MTEAGNTVSESEKLEALPMSCLEFSSRRPGAPLH